MSTKISIAKGTVNPDSTSGLTLAEPAFNTANNTLWIGKGSGNSPIWIGAGICGASSGIAAGLTYQIPTAGAVKDYIVSVQGVSSWNGQTGAVSFTNYVSSFNGLTGAVGGVCASQSNTFTALQTFSLGVSASGITVGYNTLTTVGYSGSVNIDSVPSSAVYPVLSSGTGGQQLYVDKDTTPLVYRPASGRLELTGISLGSGSGTLFMSYNSIQHTQDLYLNTADGANSGIAYIGGTADISGNMVVHGSMTVSGGVTFTISENVLIEDNIITLNSNVTGSPTENAGVEIERGTSANVQLLWNESSDKWTFTNDGSTYYDLPTSVVTSFNGRTGAVTGASLGSNTFTQVNYFSAGLCAAGITSNGNIDSYYGKIKSIGLSTITGYSGGYASESVIGPDTITFIFDGSGGQVLRPSNSNVDSSDRINWLPESSGVLALQSQLMGAINGSTAATTAVTSFNGRTGAVQGVSSASAGTGISVSAATGAVTITNTGVQSFNGNTGAVTGASLGANTFTGTQTFTAGLTTSYLYASTGSTFASTLQVSGGATFSGRVDVGGNFKVLGDSQLGDASTDTLTVYAGTTFQNRTDFAGSNNFVSGLSASGTLTTTSNIKFNGTTEKTIYTSQAPLTISGITSGASIGNENSIVFGVQTDSSLTLNSTTGTVVFSTTTAGENPSVAKISLVTDDADIYGGQSVTIGPSTYLTGTRTLTVPDDSGTIALTKNVISSFNGRTGSVQGVSAAVAGTGISVSGATGSVTITNIGVQSFNGLTGAVGGVTTSAANTFTALQTFNSGITASGITTSSLYVSGGVVSTQGFTFGSGTTFMQWVPNTSSNNGGLWLRDGNFQIGGSQFGAGYGSFYYVPNSERFYVFGYSDINNPYDYQAGRPALRLNVGPNQTAPILAAYGQTASGTILGAVYSTTNMVAGIDNKGAFFTTVGISAAGGITFNSTAQFNAGLSASAVYASTGSTFVNNVSFNSTTSHTGLATFSGGISAGGGTFSSQLNAQNLKMLTVGGDEGGQIDFGLAATNTTLSGNVAIDIYQNKLRFFETGGSARGAYIDLTAASAGVGTDLIGVVSVNGYTGAVGAVPPAFGTTGDATIRVITYPDGVTTQRADRSQYFWTFSRTYQSGGSMTMYANRTYFQPQSVSKSTTIKSLRFMGANTGITGNCYFSIWSADPNNGNPSSRLYASASTVVGSGYNYTTVTNASGLVTIPAGNWWLAVSFSSTPTIYSQHKDYILPYAGATDFNSGYKNYYPVVDTNGFTAPTAISGTGITYAWVEYHPSIYISPHFEWQTT